MSDDELARVKQIGATPLSAAEIKESDEIAIRHEIESGSSQARFAILDAYYAGRERAMRIGESIRERAERRAAFGPTDRDIAELVESLQLCRAARDAAEKRNAELLAALRGLFRAIGRLSDHTRESADAEEAARVAIAKAVGVAS